MSSTFEDLKAWQLAMELVVDLYKCTEDFPKRERYGLTDQLRRAAVSVPRNFAEGKGRASDKEMLQFLYHARGFIYEVQTQLTIARRLGYLTTPNDDRLQKRAAEVGRVLNDLIRVFRPIPARISATEPALGALS